MAYADFVTAMMALFIVLWLMNTSKQVQEAVGGYFKDPRATSKMVGTNKNGAANYCRDQEGGHGEAEGRLLQVDPPSRSDGQTEEPNRDHDHAGGTANRPDGIGQGYILRTGKCAAHPCAGRAAQTSVQELGKLPNKISIEGHTDSKPYSGKRAYDNWDLSTDRANEARRMMQSEGIRPGQISQVRGFADQRLRLPQKPMDPSNRRISMIVQYQVLDEGEVAPKIDPEHTQVTTGQL